MRKNNIIYLGIIFVWCCLVLIFEDWSYEDLSILEKTNSSSDIISNDVFESTSSIKSKSSSSASKSSSSTSRKKECRCCGKRFTHSGYKIGYGETAYGNIDKIGVQPGPYDSEYCAFLCEHMDGLG
ncbi:uncharacterized protein METZ01_LOCUS407312, partial [marine metagenome]